ncbi:MAG: general secretion pathway protein GspE, partial [Rhodocyclales bacterium CG_4_10_14_3_um_filter_68_10]
MNAATALRRLLPEARRGAVATGVRLIETLEERSALDAEAFVAALAELTGMAAMDAAGLRQTRPRFDLIPFVEAMQRRCVALEADDAGLVVITDDPFDSRQRPWAEDWLKAPFAWRLVHRGDLAAFLAGHEQDMQALDSMPHDRAVRSDDASLVEDLSLGSIGGEASEIVRLVRSTLHDALRFGASDVHFETGPDG